ncbi:MAG: hypothetical protein K2J11_11010 [Oscillospiraceae bacterium]|nr:hypothetical protein [Oscillospiraceae bacterium]
MPDTENKEPREDIPAEEPKVKKGKSFMEVYREVNERERAEELKRQSELEAARAERERKERDRYAEKLRQEKLELLKLKQGVISEEDIPTEVKAERHYTVWERVSNFFYHNKMYIIIGTAIFLILAFLVYDLVTRVKPDVTVMIIARDDSFQFYTESIEQLLERYCEDYNGDGKVDVRVFYAPAVMGESQNDLYLRQSDQTKLVAEFQSGDTVIIIADKEACEEIGVTEGVFSDLSKDFPDDKNVTELGYMLSGTSLSEDIEYSALSDDLFAAFREPHGGIGINEEKFRTNYEHAVELWNNYITKNEINPTAEDTDNS